jgi:hypothetical protein
VSWSKRIAKIMTGGLCLAIASSLTAVGCSSDPQPYSDPRSVVAPEEVPETKRIRRLTADQFFASLFIATGQRWDDEEEFAATLGRPDFAEVTAEGREMSVGFAKLAGDAARQTCRRAVEQDRSTSDPGARTILREIDDVERLDPFDPGVTENLRYLMLRFLGVYVTDDADRRLQPWLKILQDGLDPSDDTRFEGAQDRWTAVCAGLALHPDFLTY